MVSPYWNPSLSSNTETLRALSAIRDFASWQGARCRRLCAQRFAGSARCLLGEKEKRKEKKRREGKKKKVNDSLLCSTSFIRLDYIEHHPRGTRPLSLYALAFLLPLFQPPSPPLPLSLPCLPRFPGFFPSSFFLSFPQASFYTSLDACTHLHTAISLYRAYTNVYAFQHARTRAYN